MTKLPAMEIAAAVEVLIAKSMLTRLLDDARGAVRSEEKVAADRDRKQKPEAAE